MKFALLFGFIYLCLLNPAVGEEIDRNCLQSYNVKEKIFELNSQTVSCRLFEQDREKAFIRLSSLSESAEIEYAEAIREVNNIADELEAAESSGDWSFAASIVVGNFLATVGLISCAETVGAGCALAAVAFVWAKIQTISEASDISIKKNASTELRIKLRKLGGTNAKANEILRSRDQLVAEFNLLCATVQENCL